MEVLTPKQAIFHSASLLRKTITVQGKVVFQDVPLRRVDIAHEGAKLIVRLPDALVLESAKNIAMNETIFVSGMLKKEQRRTFLEATKVQRC